MKSTKPCLTTMVTLYHHHQPANLESQRATVQSSEQVAKVRESKNLTQLTQSSWARSIELTSRRVSGSNSSTLLCSHAAARMDLKLLGINRIGFCFKPKFRVF